MTHLGDLVCEGKFYALTKGFPEHGYEEGETVLVVGEGFFPVTQEDPYLFRRYFAVARFKDGVLNFQEKPIVVAPESLGPINEDVQESLQAMLKLFEDNRLGDEMPH